MRAHQSFNIESSDLFVGFYPTLTCFVCQTDWPGINLIDSASMRKLADVAVYYDADVLDAAIPTPRNGAIDLNFRRAC